MTDWKYNPDEYNPNGFELIPPGDYRVRIEDCEEKYTQTGKDMYKLTLAVSGHSARVWYCLVFDSSNEEMRKYTNQRLGSVYDSFNITRGNLNPDDWKGKTGGAKIKHRLYNDEMRAEISYFLTRKKVDALPAWQEGNSTSAKKSTSEFGNIGTEMFSTDEGFDNI